MSTQQLIPTTDAIIARQENISTIIQAGPESYQKNALSSQRCSQAGSQLLDEIKTNGMSDDLDRRLAAYIEKTRITLKKMNERRSPVTKLFDQVRSEFTVLENSIDPTKNDTIPFLIAQHRNAYAAKKREEEERRHQAELAAQEHIKAKECYRAAIEEALRQSFDLLVTASINELTNLNSNITLDTYNSVFNTVTDFNTRLPADWCPLLTVRQPYNLTAEEAKTISSGVFQKLLPVFEEQFAFEVGDYRQEILDELPSKKTELERIAKADAAEAEKIKAELAKREAEEAARKERERIAAEEEARKKAEMDKANAEMAGLFAMNKAEAVYTPKAKVTKKIQINDPSAFLGIVSLWWQREGRTLSVEELSKIFKKQVTFCEKLANKENVFVEGAALEYIDDVKAK